MKENWKKSSYLMNAGFPMTAQNVYQRNVDLHQETTMILNWQNKSIDADNYNIWFDFYLPCSKIKIKPLAAHLHLTCIYRLSFHRNKRDLLPLFVLYCIFVVLKWNIHFPEMIKYYLNMQDVACSVNFFMWMGLDPFQ